MNDKSNINELVAKRILGASTPEEDRLLENLLDEDPELKSKVEGMFDNEAFVMRYRQFASIDKREAKKRFFDIHESRPASAVAHAATVWLKRIASVAAVAVVGIVLWHLAMDNRKSATPQIDEKAIVAMEKLEKSGINEATLLIKGAKASNVSSATAAAEIMQNNRDAAAEVQETDTPEATLVTHHDKEFWMVLDDGTHVHLNYNSSLTYPMHFNGKERRVFLEGEAYFFVAKDNSHPLVVSTPYGDIRDYGTEFCVNTKPRQGCASVVLVKGKVGVVPSNGRETILRPGEKAEFTGNHRVTVSKVDVEPYVAWNTGQFFFDGCSLEELTDVFSRWYNIGVVFESDDIKTMRFTGDINKYDDILPTIHAIKEVTGVDITLRDGVMTIKGKE